MTEPATYRHTQTGKTIWLFLLIALLGSIAAVALAGIAVMMIVTITGLLILSIGWIFGSLTVAVSGGVLSW